MAPIKTRFYWDSGVRANNVTVSIIEARNLSLSLSKLELPSNEQPLHASRGTLFETTIDLAEGLYYFIFHIDGVWRFAFNFGFMMAELLEISASRQSRMEHVRSTTSAWRATKTKMKMVCV